MPRFPVAAPRSLRASLLRGRALLGLPGLVSIALGVALAIRPDIGAITIAQGYGLQ
jgi:hypothetical protein